MSVSHNKKRKAAKAKRTEYQKKIASQIKSGILPQFHFARGPGGELERSPVKNRFQGGGLTLRLLNTFAVLTKDHYEETPELAPLANEEVE